MGLLPHDSGMKIENRDHDDRQVVLLSVAMTRHSSIQLLEKSLRETSCEPTVMAIEEGL